MIIHCNESGCQEIENISVAHLMGPPNLFSEASEIDLDQTDKQTPGLPYKFQDLVETIQDTLPFWKTQIIIEGSEKRLHLTCPKHFSLESRVSELITQAKSTMDKYMRSKPYVGITGFKTVEEVQAIVNYLDKENPLSELGYTVMFGFTCSNKRLADPASSGKTSPSLHSLKELCKAVTPKYLSMIHYFTDHPGNLVKELQQVLEPLYPDCCGLQINQTWPDPAHLLELHKIFPKLQTVVQMSADALLEDDHSLIALRSTAYKTEYLLMDPSGGQGKDFDINKHQALITDLEAKMPNTRLGIAGGFGPDNVVGRFLQISELTANPFCIDAQGKLRSHDALDSAKVIAYLKNAALAIRNSKFGRQ